MIQQTSSEGTSFDKRGGDSNKQKPPYDKKYWDNMQCFRCLQKDYLSSHCTITITNTNSNKTIEEKIINRVNQIISPRLSSQKV